MSDTGENSCSLFQKTLCYVAGFQFSFCRCEHCVLRAYFLIGRKGTWLCHGHLALWRDHMCGQMQIVVFIQILNLYATLFTFSLK